MATRIRYKKTDSVDVLRSAQTFPHGTRVLEVTLNVKDMSFMIVDKNNGSLVNIGTAKDLHKLKIYAKNALTTLGVVFVEEKRGEEYGRTNKKAEQVTQG